jgi:hypothetical protein
MEEMTKNAEVLLQQVSALNKKHEEIARITGRQFNVFSILGVESRETSTHSAFLVEVLNPKGSHGQGKMFLELFIEMLGKKIPVDKIPLVNSERIEVKKEKNLGAISKNYTEGGRADIIIFGTNGSICIENKIYAKDQKNQLVRYYNHYVSDKKGGLLLYLTLYGSDPSKESIAGTKSGKPLDKGEDFFTVSYETDILEWLLKCQSESIDVPTVRDVIGQYIYLIKKLTRQSMNDTQRGEFIELITKGKNPDAVLHINDGLHSFIEKIKSRLDYTRKDLISRKWRHYKSSEIWDKTNQVKKLQSVLVISLNAIQNISGVQIKVRLSPHGWRIELWNSQSIQVENFAEPAGEYFIYKRLPFETEASDVLNVVKKLMDDLESVNN